MTDVTETWHVLAWKDNAGRDDSMAGPLSALQAQKEVLEKNDIDYTLEEIGSATTRTPKKRTAKKSATKKVADKELEVRDEA